MEIPVEEEEIKFQSNYRLVEIGKQTLGSPMAALGFPGLSHGVRSADTTMDIHLKKLESYNAQMKVFIAQESNNGDNFLQPLGDCKAILERIVAINQSKLSSSSHKPGFCQFELSRRGRLHLNSTYNLITEKLLFYFQHIRQSRMEMGTLLLDVLCLIVTLDSESHSIFPQVFASCLLFFKPLSNWKDANKEVMNRLCYFVLPKCLVCELQACPWMNLSATLMMVLEGCTATKDHLLIINTLMQLKKNVCLDILSVIAYGTMPIREKALNLLLHYWPIPIPEFSNSNCIYGEWTTPLCENGDCQHNKASIASMLCMDPLCVAQYKQNGPKLYMLLCPECDSIIHGSPPHGDHMRIRVPKPLHDVKPNCEFQKICSGKERQVNRAEVTCYDPRCTAIQHGHPIRMCRDCHNKQHKDTTNASHIYQVSPPDPWTQEDPALCTAMLEAVSKLLEVTPSQNDLHPRGGGVGTVSRGGLHQSSFSPRYQIEIGISREGMWILSHYCTPTTLIRGDTQKDWLTHLSALTLNWLQAYYNLLHTASIGLDEGQNYSPGGGDFVDTQFPDYSRLFSNYGDISNLVNTYTLPWFRHVCESNDDCVSEVLKPEVCGCAQVGKLWNESHDQIKRYKHTLDIIHTLYLLFQEGKLPEKTFMVIFKTVMPMWLDFLVAMRQEPGRMELLKEQFKLIFFHEKHEEGLKTFGFVWDLFRENDSESMHKALLWLQDLTRLKVPIAYLKHMFENALQKKRGHGKYSSVDSSFDQESERELVKRHRESTGSLSGYESESALVSQTSIDSGETQQVLTLNSSLTRFILMLDIWSSQLIELQVLTMDAASLHTILVKMLRHPWGTSHTYLDHKESSNLCLLCHGMQIWFGLASKLIREYARLVREDSAGEEGVEDTVSPITQQRSFVSIRSIKLSTPRRNRRKFFSSSDSPDMRVVQRPRMKKLSQDSMDNDPHISEDEENSNLSYVQRSRVSPGNPHHPNQRKLAKVLSHSDLVVVPGLDGGGASSGGTGGTRWARVTRKADAPGIQEEDTSPALYTVFQLTIEKLSYKLHPDTLLHIVRCLLTLVGSGHVLKVIADYKLVREDLNHLFEKLWACLEADTSNVARSCARLLLECVEYLSAHPCGQEEEEEDKETKASVPVSEQDQVKSKIKKRLGTGGGRRGGKKEGDDIFWKSLESGLTSTSWTFRFRTIEKLTVLLEFMLSSDDEGIEYQSFHQYVKETLGHGFCLLTMLLQDKNTNVCARAKYCITSIKESSLQAIRHFLTVFFQGKQEHRPLVLQTLSLLDSTLPEIQFLNLDLLNKLMTMALHGVSPVLPGKNLDIEGLSQRAKKISDGSLRGHAAAKGRSGIKISTGSSSSSLYAETVDNSDLAQQVLSLLLRHVGNPRADVKESMQKAYQASFLQTPKKTITIKKSQTAEEMFVVTLRKVVFNELSFPHDLRNSPIFEVFLNHIFPVLDHNIEFGQTKGLIRFILKLLGYSAAPQSEECSGLLQDRQLPENGPSYSLGALPSQLQAPWLRVFFVIIYKYIHNCSDSDSALQNLDMNTLASWCMQITLNSLEALPHECPVLNGTGTRPHPVLHRQVESFEYSDKITNRRSRGENPVISEGGLSVAQGGGREGMLTPVPEDPKNQEDLNQSDSETTESDDHVTSPLRARGRGGSFDKNDSGGATYWDDHVTSPLRGGETSEQSEKKAPAPTPSSHPWTQEPPIGRCVVCGNPTNEFSEEVVALCSVAIGTFCNRLPHMVPRYLVSRIIPAIAKVVSPGFYTWQKFNISNNNPLPGSASAVAQHLLASILTQFGERRLFLYLFGYNHDTLKEAVFSGIAGSLEDMEGEVPADQTGGGDKEGEEQLCHTSPIKYFLEDANSSPHFNQDVSKYSFINLAAYLEALDNIRSQALATAPPISLSRDLLLWDVFLKKVKGHTEILRSRKAVKSLFQIIIRLFQYTIDYQLPQYSLSNYKAHAVQSVIQSLTAILETALHNVYCPLGGIVMLGGLWYKVFQQHSHRESEKLVKLLIYELRKALKAKTTTVEVVTPENFLALIQVLLLEENGYLGYVDGLTQMKHFAPELTQEFEIHCLPVIQSSQWDFLDVLNFLITPSLQWQEMVSQLKLSLAQLIALRVQHGRLPDDKLRKMIAGDNKITISSSSKSGSGVSSQWQSCFDTLHMLSWLLLGAMSHNAIHSVASEMKSVTSSGGLCLLMESLSSKMEDVVKRAVFLTKSVLQRLATYEPELKSDYLEMTFVFGAILTVYIELYAKEDSAPLILEYWEKVCGCLSYYLINKMEVCSPQQLARTTLYCTEVIHSLNEQVMTRIREIDLSCYPLLLPVWQEVATKTLPNKRVTSMTTREATHTPVNIWFDEAVAELLRIEFESIPNNLLK